MRFAESDIKPNAGGPAYAGSTSDARWRAVPDGVARVDGVEVCKLEREREVRLHLERGRVVASEVSHG